MKGDKRKSSATNNRDLASKVGFDRFVSVLEEEGKMDKSSTARPAIVELKDGRARRFQIRVKVGSLNFRGAWKTRESAERVADEIEQIRKSLPPLRHNQTFRIPGGKTTTLRTLNGLMEDWLADEDTRQCPSTKVGYWKSYKFYVAPDFGNCMLHQVDQESFNKTLRSMVDKNLSKGSVVQVKTVLKVLNDYAKTSLKYPSDKLLNFATNEAGGNLQFKQLKHYEAIEQEDLEKIISSIFKVKRDKRLNPVVPYAILTASLTGMRSGEIRALQWGDIDYKKKEISIQRGITKRTKAKKITKKIGKDYVESTVRVSEEYCWNRTKTDASRRTLELSIELETALHELRDEWTQAMGRAPKKDDFMFIQVTGPHRGDFLRYYRLRYGISSYFKRAGLSGKLTMHQLRASFATILLRTAPNPGAALVNVQRMLGHTDVSTTAIYAQSRKSERREMVNSLPRYVFKGNSDEMKEDVDYSKLSKEDLIKILESFKKDS